MARVYNFSAGPAVLPEEVLKEAADEMLDYKGCGMSVMEMSHRSKMFQQIIDEAEQDIRDLMGIPDNYKVLVTADSSRFLSEAQKLERVYVIPGKIFHPHYVAEGKNPFLKSFIDFYMLMEAEKVHLLKTGPMYKSGFPEFAALLGNKPFIYSEF